MRLMPVLLTLAVALAVSAGPASARRYLSIEDVRYIAFDHGIVKIEEIKLKRKKDIWKVEGDDAWGHEIEMKIDAWTGYIIKIERD
jgi:uncharacterized membrane protein YkoI